MDNELPIRNAELEAAKGQQEDCTFTAPQIANCLGVSRQAIYARLRLSDGGECAWHFSSLPLDWQLEITRRGVKRGYENGEAYLRSLPEPWNPPMPWERVPAAYREKAVRLQKALLNCLRMRTDGKPAAEVQATGLADFKAEFKYEISSKQWRRIFQRTLDRDAGEENWQRQVIYLDERAFMTSTANREATLAGFDHKPLDEVFSAVQNRQNPSAEDRQVVWYEVLKHFAQLTEAMPDSKDGNRQRRLCKASLLHYLSEAFPPGTLCTTAKSLRRRFEEKLNQWQEAGGDPQALADNRSAKSGKFGKKLCAECRPLVVGGAVDLDGDLSQAWRRLQLGRQLCRACAEIGSYDERRNKSEVPKSVRADVTPDILAAVPHRRGPKHVRLCSPYVRRDWNDIGPGDWAECDDMTPNHAIHGMVEALTWDTDEGGQPYIGRLEALFQIDRRTDYPWAYLLILGDPASVFTPQRKASYSSVHCRLLFLRGHDALGIPHSGGGFVLENGIWASRLIDGPRLQHWESSPWHRTEMGLQDPRIGLNVRHAIPGNPRSKVIERVFLSVQNRMRCLPGFVGFNERQDKRERMDDFIRRVKAGKEHPGNEVPNISDFRTMLDAEIMAHANEPQNGERLPGVSPKEAFLNGIGGRPGIKDRPLRMLGENARFLLSTHERLMTVTAQGITYKIGGSQFVFWGAALEPYQHKQILTRFNLEEPELLTCQPQDGEPFTLKARILPSTTATKEQLQEAARERASWTRRGKIIHDTLPHPFKATITRDNEQSEETRNLGRFQNGEVERYRAEKAKTDRSVQRARKKAQQAGYDPSRLRMKNPDRVAELAPRIQQQLEALKRLEASQHNSEEVND